MPDIKRTFVTCVQGSVCEWDPDANSEAYKATKHSAASEVHVVDPSDGDDFYLCAGCAALPRFSSFTTRGPATDACPMLSVPTSGN